MNINNFDKNKSFLKKHLGSIINISIIVRIKPESHQNFKSERKGGEPETCIILKDRKMKIQTKLRSNSHKIKYQNRGITATRGRKCFKE